VSRWLWLVKWLMVIPHFVVLFFLWCAVSVLTVVAGFTILFTGRYPQRIFDLVMGLNRWCYRVLAYAALMRDEYPPFRLDNGGTDPGHTVPVPAGPPGPQPAPTASPS